MFMYKTDPQLKFTTKEVNVPFFFPSFSLAQLRSHFLGDQQV